MDLGIKGKRALVGASSQGLGRAIAEALAAEGVDVLLTGRNEEALATTQSAINSRAGGRAHVQAGDLTDPDLPQILHAAAERHMGGVDILVNNTGGPPPGQMVDANLDTAAQQFDQMILPVARITETLLPQMRTQKWGRILTVASSGVIQPIPNLGLSNMLRSALVGWSKSLANDLGPDGITVNMLIPGRIHTNRVDIIDTGAAKRSGKTLEEIRQASKATIPVGRYGKPEEFGAAAAFLASQQAAYVTGMLMRIDGGLIKSV